MLATIALCIDLTSPASADHSLDHRRAKVQRSISQAQTDIGEASSRLRRATNRLQAAAGTLQSAKIGLRELKVSLDVAIDNQRLAERRLNLARAELRSTRARLAASREATEAQGDEVVDAIVSRYQQVDPQLLAVNSLLGSDNFSDLIRRESANEVIVANQEQLFDQLRASEIIMEVEEGRAEEAAEIVAAASREAAEAVSRQRTLAIETREATRAIVKLVGRRREARQEAARARERDLAVLQRLESEEDRIRDQIRRRALRAAARGRHDSSSPQGGYLGSPVEGVVTSPYGFRTHPIYGYWSLHDGIDFGAACGQPLFAAASGVVTSAYYSSVYGQRLFVRAGVAGGQSITLIYNHAAGYRVRPGDRVQRGQVIGSVGDTGWSTGCHLHFTVLANGAAKDPANWF
jgi:murein DD-endopeptidase MepM/ murein hydrolase activator NlpD